MFYSHDILTSRKYGVATVWLVATLGSKTKKINKKAILDVNVRKACETIIQPEAPMALRLQSSLLCGVSRVYDQQCGYVLSDAQLAQTHMRGLLKIIRNGDLDLEAGKAKKDQLVLHNDPTFFPELALPPLDFDIEALDWSQSSSQMSPRSSSQTSPSPSRSLLDFQLNSSSGNSVYHLPILDPFQVGSARKHTNLGRAFDEEPLVFEDDLGFDIGEDGELYERATPASARVFGSDPAASNRVRMEHEAGLLGRDMEMGDDFMPQLEDDHPMLPDAEAFPTSRKRAMSHTTVNSDISSAEAPQKRIRVRKARVVRRLAADQNTQLRRQELTSFAEDYLANMKEVKDSKEKKMARKESKQTAYDFVFGGGLNDFVVGDGQRGVADELKNLFAGDALRFIVTGHINIKNQRKASSPHRGPKAESGRSPASEQQDQVGRRDEDDGFRMDFGDETEVGRDDTHALEDHPSSAMPWNISASLNSLRVQSGVLGRLSSVPLGRQSRVTSASPLMGRGRPDSTNARTMDELQQFDDLEPLNLGSSEHNYGEIGAGLCTSSQQIDDEFEYFGAAAAVDTQTAGTSQFMREALAKESAGFLEWVRNTIAEEQADELDDEGENQETQSRDGGKKESVTFDELISPEIQNALVAASAFHHVLTLATSGMLYATQRQPFGTIELSIRELVF